MQRQVWLILLADETQGVQVKLLSLDNAGYLSASETFHNGGAIQIDDLYLWL